MEVYMVAFADLEEVEKRLDFELDEKQQRAVRALLEDASEEAEEIAGMSWPSRAAAPRKVRRIVRNVVVRYAKNPDGYIQSRSGDETVAWRGLPDGVDPLHFTDDERLQLRSIRTGGVSFGVVQVTVWNGQRGSHVTWPPTLPPSGDPMPIFGPEE